MPENKIIGVCYCGVAAEYQEELCNDLIDYANKHGGIRLVFFTSFTNSATGTSQDIGEFRVFDLINWDKLDGMLILGQSIPDSKKVAEIADNAKKNGVACIGIDCRIDDCPSITYHCEKTLYRITEHLIKEHGCKKINFLAGFRGNAVSDEREEGYKKALLDNGLEIEESRIKVGWWWSKSAVAAVEEWLDEGSDFDALVCANDLMAIAALQVLSKHGIRVPEDVKLTGIDMLTEGQQITPQLTTADFDRHIDVSIAFDMLFGKIEGNVSLEPNIVFSESCGCKKAVELNINDTLRKLTEFNDRLYMFNQKNYSLESRIIEQPDWKSALEMIQKDTSEAWVKKLWLCVNSDFIRTKLDDVEKPQVGYQTPEGYAKMQRIIAFKDMDNMSAGQQFPTAELIPDFDREIEECRFLLVFPLHINDSSIGYGVREISEFSESERWYLYSRSVSNALMIVRQENDLTLSNRMLEEMYNRDSMTRLYNRRGFFKNLSRLLDEPNKEKFVVISIDLDGLKDINDNYGHLEGDNAIITIAGIISQLCATDFICARFGGDEFLAAGFAQLGRGADFELQFQQKIERYNQLSGKPYKISASTGRIEKEYSEDDDFDTMIMLADEIMYRNKASKKNMNFRGQPRNG